MDNSLILSVNLGQDFEVLVNYNEKLETKVLRLKERGLMLANKDITTENFPAPAGRSGTVKMTLSFPSMGNNVSEVNMYYARRAVELGNLELGDPYQLLDFIDQNWHRMQEHANQELYVAAPATSWPNPDGRQCVVYFRCDETGRGLSLVCTTAFLKSRFWCFLGLRPEPSNA